MVLRSRRLLAAVVAAAAMVAVAPAASGAGTPQPVLQGDDWSAPVGNVPQSFSTTQGLFDDDPTGLVPKTPFVQRYSLDQDHWEVWLCGSVSSTLPQAIAALQAATVDYYDSLSGGVYEPVFTAGGTIPTDSSCVNGFFNGTYTPVGSPEGLFVIDSVTGGGFASPGTICISTDPDCSWIGSTFPSNQRYAVVGESSLLNYPSVTAHELGHTLQWPHSNSGTGDEYDNPLDLMSGNSTTGGWTEPDPYATLSYNRFQSGWVAADDVVIADGSYQAVTLRPHNVAGTQLFAIKTAQPGRFYVLGARTTSTYDPIPSAWQGVEVYVVDYYCDEGAFGGGICPGIYRDQTQQPPSPNGVGHVLQAGESIEIEGITVTVTGATPTGYTSHRRSRPGCRHCPVRTRDSQRRRRWGAGDAHLDRSRRRRLPDPQLRRRGGEPGRRRQHRHRCRGDVVEDDDRAGQRHHLSGASAGDQRHRGWSLVGMVTGLHRWHRPNRTRHPDGDSRSRLDQRRLDGTRG